MDVFTCENTAYQKLDETGLCDRGIVPRYHGSVLDLDPEQYLPHLVEFLNDKAPPCAILLEYIPDLQILDLTTFTQDRKRRFTDAMADLHRLGILHGDIQPRHLAVQSSSDRIVIIDFDRAQNFPPNILTPKWIRLFHNEVVRVESLLEDLVSCHSAYLR